MELAVDAGKLHAIVKDRRAYLAIVEAERDARRTTAARTDRNRRSA